MIIRKNYGNDEYITMMLTDIKFNEYSLETFLVGKLLDEKGCSEFKSFKTLSVIMDKNVEVIKQ